MLATFEMNFFSLSYLYERVSVLARVLHRYICLIEGHSIADFNITGIAKLVNLPSNPENKLERLGNFEGYWQIKLMTLEPYGLNDREEFFSTRSGGKRGNFLRY